MKKPRTTKSATANKASTVKAQKKVVGKKGDFKWVITFGAGWPPALPPIFSVSEAGAPRKQKWLHNPSLTLLLTWKTSSTLITNTAVQPSPAARCLVHPLNELRYIILELVNVFLMPFSFLFCCVSNRIKHLHSDSTSNGNPISSKASLSSLFWQVSRTNATVCQETSTPKVSNTLSPVEAAHSIHETNSSSPSKKAETYTPQRALEIFKNYTKKDDKTVIETEGFEQLCSDANIAFDGALPLILAWQMGAKEMGKITKDEWVKGTSSLRCVLCCFSCLRYSWYAIEFLHCRCCHWLWLNWRTYLFVVVLQSSRRAKKTIMTDLSIIRMLKMWKLVSTNSTCSPTRLSSRSKHILCNVMVVLPWVPANIVVSIQAVEKHGHGGDYF